jgi:hypothetical protein
VGRPAGGGAWVASFGPWHLELGHRNGALRPDGVLTMLRWWPRPGRLSSDIGHLSSALCSYDIVKRVVTVKQVRPSSPPVRGGVRSGLGMGMRSAAARAAAGRCSRAARVQGQATDDGLDEALRAQAEGLARTASDL